MYTATAMFPPRRQKWIISLVASQIFLIVVTKSKAEVPAIAGTCSCMFGHEFSCQGRYDRIEVSRCFLAADIPVIEEYPSIKILRYLFSIIIVAIESSKNFWDFVIVNSPSL